MIPHPQDQSLAPNELGHEPPLVVHGVCWQNMLNENELPQNAFGIGTVRQIIYGSLIAICSECPEIFHGPEAISAVFEDPKRVMKIAVGHNTILSELVKKYDILPLKLGTVCSTESEVRQLLSKEAEGFEVCLNHINHSFEFGIKIIETEQARQTQIQQESHVPQGGNTYPQEQAKRVSEKRQHAN